jgi:hypothetical protein
MLISTALLLDSIIRNSVCTPAKLPCRRVEVGYESLIVYVLRQNCRAAGWRRDSFRNESFLKDTALNNDTENEFHRSSETWT